jgi:hypothetical protein
MAALGRPGGGRARSEFIVIKEFVPLRDSGHRRLAVRVMQGERGRRLDIREYLAGDDWSGYTKRGINLSSAEFHALLERLDELLPLLEGGPR